MCTSCRATTVARLLLSTTREYDDSLFVLLRITDVFLTSFFLSFVVIRSFSFSKRLYCSGHSADPSYRTLKCVQLITGYGLQNVFSEGTTNVAQIVGPVVQYSGCQRGGMFANTITSTLEECTQFVVVVPECRRALKKSIIVGKGQLGGTIFCVCV